MVLYPKKVATVMSWTQMFFGFGYMIGKISLLNNMLIDEVTVIYIYLSLYLIIFRNFFDIITKVQQLDRSFIALVDFLCHS